MSNVESALWAFIDEPGLPAFYHLSSIFDLDYRQKVLKEKIFPLIYIIRSISQFYSTVHVLQDAPFSVKLKPVFLAVVTEMPDGCLLNISRHEWKSI